MKRNTRGFTIVEIVVVIAIVSVLAGVGVYGVSQLTGFHAREGADSIVNSLTQARVAMLGKSKGAGNMAWEIYCNDGDYYVRTVYNVGTSEYYRDEKKIVDSKVKVYVGETTKNTLTDAGNTTLLLLGDGQSKRYYFNRSTGALCDTTGATVNSNAYINVEQGRKDYDIMIVSKTGKILTQTVRK